MSPGKKSRSRNRSPAKKNLAKKKPKRYAADEEESKQSEESETDKSVDNLSQKVDAFEEIYEEVQRDLIDRELG